MQLGHAALLRDTPYSPDAPSANDHFLVKGPATTCKDASSLSLSLKRDTIEKLANFEEAEQEEHSFVIISCLY